MTNPIAWFMAKWLLWIFEADPDELPDESLMGDVPHVPAKAKGRAG